MKKVFNIFIFWYVFSQICLCQTTVTKEFKLRLVNASESQQKSNLILVKEDNRVFELPDSLSQYDCLIFRNELKYHLTNLEEKIEQYWSQLPILLCYNNDKMLISLDTDYDNSFRDEEF